MTRNRYAPVARRATIYESVAASLSTFDAVECPSMMQRLSPDPDQCIFCGHARSRHDETGCHGGRQRHTDPWPCRCLYRADGSSRIDGLALSEALKELMP